MNHARFFSARSTPMVLATALGLTLSYSVCIGVGTSDTSSVARSDGTRLSDLSWIAGQWSTKLGGDTLEEIWSEPKGDSMMGVFRWIKGDKVWMYEMLTIREVKGKIIFQFKHFTKALVGWEEKAESLTFELSSYDGKSAVFDRVNSDEQLRYTFVRAGKDALTIRLGGSKNGGGKIDEFKYKRS